jgi:iron(III) transport system permease protein
MLMIQVFDTPFVIGMTAGVPVLSTRIYALAASTSGSQNYGLAAAFGVFLVAAALLLMWGYFRAVQVGEKFRIVTGRGFRPRKAKLGRWRYLAGGFVCAYFALMALPLLILAWLSLLQFYEAPSLQVMKDLNFGNYAAVLKMSMVRDAVGNTLVAAFSTATLGMVLASVVSWYSVRKPTPWSHALDALTFMPIAIPGVVMAVATLLAYLRTPLYGTVWIIVLAQVTVALPFGARMMNGALMQVHKELEQAAAASGAKWFTSLRTILLPLLLPHFLNGWLWTAAQSTRDLTIPFLLQTTDNMMISPALLQLWNTPDYPGAAALSVLMIFASMAVVIPVQIFAARRA